MISVFDEIEKSESANQTAAIEAWKKLCRDIAAGKPVKPELVKNVLTAAGKSRSDSEAQVRLYQQRAEKHALLAAVPAHQKRIDEINAACEAADQERNAALRKHSDTTGPLVEERTALLKEIQRADDAAAWLARNCPDSQINAAHRAKQMELRQLIEQRSELSRARASLETRLSHYASAPMAGNLTPWEKSQGEEAKRITQQIESIELQLAPVNQAIAAANDEIKAITEAMVAA